MSVNELWPPSHEAAAVTVDCISRLSGPVRLALRYTTPDIHCRDRRYKWDGGISGLKPRYTLKWWQTRWMFVALSKIQRTTSLRHLSRVSTVPEKSWIMQDEKSGPGKSWKWAQVLKKCWYLITKVLKNSSHRSPRLLLERPGSPMNIYLKHQDSWFCIYYCKAKYRGTWN